ncbi:MAG: GEVED domain-containing protein [Bacteroidota bacterium]
MIELAKLKMPNPAGKKAKTRSIGDSNRGLITNDVQAYCSAAFQNRCNVAPSQTTAPGYIANVSIPGTTLNNASDCPGTGTPIGFTVYTNAAANRTATLEAGKSYNVVVNINRTGRYGFYTYVWLDANCNQVFEPSEFFEGPFNGQGNTSIPITVPANVPDNGQGRLRVRISALDATAADACASLEFGEGEDYTLTFKAATKMNIISFTPPSGNEGDSVYIKGTKLGRATSVKFNGTAATAYYATNDTLLTAAVPAGATTGFITLASDTESASTARPFYIGTQIDTAAAGVEYSTCDAMIVNEDSAGGYRMNENLLFSIVPSEPGKMAHIDFTHFDLEALADYVYIFDGDYDNNFTNFIDSYSGTTLPPSFTATNPEGRITIGFLTDETVSSTGFKAVVTCRDPLMPEGVSFFPPSARVGWPVTIYAKNTGPSSLVTIDDLPLDSVFYSTDGYYIGLMPEGVADGVIVVGNSVGNVSPATNIQLLADNICLPRSTMCSPFLNGNSTAITNVTIANTSLRNTSDCSKDLAYNAVAWPARDSTTAILYKDSTYTLSATTNSASIIAYWFDWDASGTFENTEWTRVIATSVANTPATKTFTVPATATVGQTVLRVKSRKSGSANGGATACSGWESGETEDYYVTIAQLVGNKPLFGKGVAAITPNPNNGSFSLNLSELKADGDLNIVDALGRTVYSQHISINSSLAESSFNAKDLLPGVYNVVVTSGNTRGTQRMVVQK